MTSQGRDPFEDLGSAAGMVAGGVLTTWGASFMGAEGALRLAWFVPAIIMSLAGFVLVVSHVAQLRKPRERRGMEDMGVDVVLGVVAASLYWTQATFSVPGPLLGGMKFLVLVIAFFALFGFFLGLGKYLGAVIRNPDRAKQDRAQRRESRARFTAEVISLLTALASLTAAIITVVQATSG